MRVAGCSGKITKGDLVEAKEMDYADADIREKVTAIREANIPTPLPAPMVPPDSFHIQFSKDAGEQLQLLRPSTSHRYARPINTSS